MPEKNKWNACPELLLYSIAYKIIHKSFLEVRNFAHFLTGKDVFVAQNFLPMLIPIHEYKKIKSFSSEIYSTFNSNIVITVLVNSRILGYCFYWKETFSTSTQAELFMCKENSCLPCSANFIFLVCI